MKDEPFSATETVLGIGIFIGGCVIALWFAGVLDF
jgi:hypothetical protein